MIYKEKVNRFIKNQRNINLADETKALLLQYFEAMAHFYEIIPLKKVYEILTDAYNEEISEQGFYELTDAVHKEPIGFYYIDGEDELVNEDNTNLPEYRLIIHESVVSIDLDDYYVIQELKNGKPYYIPEKDELLRYSDDFYSEETEQVVELRKFFIRTLGTDPKRAVDLVDELIMISTKENRSLDQALDDLQRMRCDMDINQIKEFIPYYTDLCNNIRMPSNNGYTAKETEELFKDSGKNINSLYIKNITLDEKHEKKRRSKTADNIRKMNEFSAMMRMYAISQGTPFPDIQIPKPEKIGRNDPCPCGSGKKYKKCCGR
ncbi:MAG: SEC-C domain-containing protein [Clostridia bacterium]|nr:SEC-C domain-containing protein [Clostridia bacterium]